MTTVTTITDYLYIGTLLLVGTFGAFAFTSYCIVNKDYKNLKQTIKDDDKKRSEEEEKQQDEDEANSYENKYSLEKAIHNKNHSDLGEKYIFEATPDGVIILNYDIENKSFNYWSDYTIHYKYLQASARRFVLDYQCKDYYIQCDEKDKKNHCGTNNRTNNNKKREEDPLCVCESDKCKLPTPMADPVDRNYTEAERDLKNMRSVSLSSTESNTAEDDVFLKPKQSANKTKTLVANKYSHRGNLIDFYGPTSKRKTGKDISFADYMKQNSE